MHSTITDLAITRRMPEPIAWAWHNVRAARGGHPHEHSAQLIGALDVTLRTLVSLLLPDYLRGAPDPRIEDELSCLGRPSLGAYRDLIRSLLSSLRQRREPGPFFPEACEWYFDAKGKPTRSARALSSLIELRNEDAHGRARTAAQMAPFADEVEGLMEDLLAGARWLRGYRIFRVLDPRLVSRARFGGRLQFLYGSTPLGQTERASWAAHLLPDTVYVASPDGERLLEVSPFFSTLNDPSVNDRRLFLFVAAPRGKWLTLRHDQSGATQEKLLPAIDEKEMPFSTWLERREELEPALANSTPAPFAALDWAGVGDLLGERYRLLEPLGRGGMATVYRVEDTYFDEERALKVLTEEASSDERLCARFRAEAKLMRHLGEHPYVLGVDDVSPLPDGRWCIAMPVVEGGTLQDQLQAGPVAPERVARWARQALEALDHLHENHVWHRDIKPSNILLDNLDDTIRLADFGIAREAGSTLRLTRATERIGTQAYMAPELLVEGGEPGPATDRFSLAVTLHELVTGALPKGTPGEGIGGELGSLIRALGHEEPARRLAAAIGEQSPLPRIEPPKRRSDSDHASKQLGLEMAVETLTDFGHHYGRLKDGGEDPVAEVFAAFERARAAVSELGWDGPQLDELEEWRSFFQVNAHKMRIHERPEIGLLQAAYAHAEQSPLSHAALHWLRKHGPDALWLRAIRRPREEKRGACLMTLGRHTGRVQAVALDPEGCHAISQGADKAIRLWDLQTGACLRSLKKHTAKVESVALGPGGRRLLCGNRDNTLKVWNLQTGKRICTLRGHGATVRAVALDRDGRRAVSGGEDEKLKVWDLETGKCLLTFEAQARFVRAVALSYEAGRAVSVSDDGKLDVWDLETGSRARAHWVHVGYMRPVALDCAGRRVLTAGRDGVLDLVEIETGDILRSIEIGDAEPDSVALDSQGRRAVLGHDDGTLNLWDLETAAQPRSSEGHLEEVTSVVLDPERRRAVSGSSDETLMVWDLETGGRLDTLAGHTKGVTALAIEPKGTCLVSGSDDGTLKVWDLEAGQRVRTLERHTGAVKSVVVDPEGRQVVSGSSDNTLRVWDLGTGELLRTLREHAAPVTGLSLDLERRHVLSGSMDETIVLWDLATCANLRRLRGHAGGVTALALHPLRRQAVSGGRDAALRLWDLEAGECVRTFGGHTGYVSSVALDAPGDRLLSGSYDGTLRVWNLQTGECLATWVAEHAVLCCAWNGGPIVAGTAAGEVLILELTPPGPWSP